MYAAIYKYVFDIYFLLLMKHTDNSESSFAQD